MPLANTPELRAMLMAAIAKMPREDLLKMAVLAEESRQRFLALMSSGIGNNPQDTLPAPGASTRKPDGTPV